MAAHNDKLSFILKYKGEDIFIDPEHIFIHLTKKKLV